MFDGGDTGAMGRSLGNIALDRSCGNLQMEANPSKPLSAFGFLTVLDDASHGYFGGYLVLSEFGRPLEFHCSTPVRPNQAQKILYGATLRSYVLGELIGQALLAKGQLPVHFVITDLAEMMSLSLIRPESLVCIEKIPDGITQESTLEGSSEHAPGEIAKPSYDGPELRLGERRLWGTSTCDWQPDDLRNSLSSLVTHVDLFEPFERIREAIQEAQRLSSPPGDETHESTAA